MKSLAKLSLLVLLSGAAAAQEPSGPRGSSQTAAGEERYDAVGLASIGPAAGMTIRSVVLRADELAEVTALDSGRTVLVRVVSGAPQQDMIAQLSTVTADALGVVGDRVPVRVRRTVASPIDEARLNAGQGADPRPDAPESLLVPLRRKLGASPVRPAENAAAAVPARRILPPTPRADAVGKPVAKPTPVTQPRPPVRPLSASVPIVRGDYVVRVGAFAEIARARSVAARLGGRIVSVGRLSRVELGPFADTAAADRARARAVAAGFPDARRTLATAP